MEIQLTKFAEVFITFHAPVIAGCICYQSYSVDTDPLPELNLLCHIVSFHFGLHFYVEYLKSFAS